MFRMKMKVTSKVEHENGIAVRFIGQLDDTIPKEERFQKEALAAFGTAEFNVDAAALDAFKIGDAFMVAIVPVEEWSSLGLNPEPEK